VSTGRAAAVPGPQEEHIKSLYSAFNERDVEAVLAGLTVDVTWANGMEGASSDAVDG